MSKAANGDVGAPEIIKLQPEPADVQTTVTHEVAPSSYAEAALLLCCFGLSLYAWLRSRKPVVLYCCVGFALLVLDYAISIALVNVSPETGPALLVEYPALEYIRNCIGPVALICLAIGMYQFIPTKNPAEQETRFE